MSSELQRYACGCRIVRNDPQCHPGLEPCAMHRAADDMYRWVRAFADRPKATILLRLDETIAWAREIVALIEEPE